VGQDWDKLSNRYKSTPQKSSICERSLLRNKPA
jgi:hypothetical protein